jgi:hypothetical protein
MMKTINAAIRILICIVVPSLAGCLSLLYEYKAGTIDIIYVDNDAFAGRPYYFLLFYYYDQNGNKGGGFHSFFA